MLPCPSCSQHCGAFVRRAQPQRIRTKEAFVSFLHQFHNAVNARLGKPIVSYAECKEKYARAKTGAVVTAFFKVFSMREVSPALMLNNMHKGHFLVRLREDLNAMRGDMRA